MRGTLALLNATEIRVISCLCLNAQVVMAIQKISNWLHSHSEPAENMVSFAHYVYNSRPSSPTAAAPTPLSQKISFAVHETPPKETLPVHIPSSGELMRL